MAIPLFLGSGLARAIIPENLSTLEEVKAVIESLVDGWLQADAAGRERITLLHLHLTDRLEELGG